jgi:hypothetical protein
MKADSSVTPIDDGHWGAVVLDSPAVAWVPRALAGSLACRTFPSLITADRVSRRQESSPALYVSSRATWPGTGCPAVSDGLDARQRQTTVAGRRDKKILVKADYLLDDFFGSGSADHSHAEPSSGRDAARTLRL